MRVNYQIESDTKPEKFVIENIINGKCDVIINDKVKKVEEKIIDELGNESIKEKYIFNSYRLLTNYRENLNDELKNEEEYEKWVSNIRNTYYNEKAQEIRNIRNELLKETDADMCLDRMGLNIPEGKTFTAWLSFFKNLGNAISGEMAKYRQELRDITEQKGFPFEVVFPTKPMIKKKQAEEKVDGKQ